MKRSKSCLLCLLALTVAPGTIRAQVYSPRVLTKSQIDTSTLASLAEGIYVKAGATTPRRKAEAIWRFFLTDGRFVTPGFWYHIAGWANEEAEGEVLDPLKLLNSYGFGEIAQTMMPDLNAASVESAMRMIEGSAKSMGLEIVD